MPKMSSTAATIHAAKDIIHGLKNSSPARPLVTLVNLHKEALISLADIFEKSTSPAVPLRIIIGGGIPRETPKGEPRREPN